MKIISIFLILFLSGCGSSPSTQKGKPVKEVKAADEKTVTSIVTFDLSAPSGAVKEATLGSRSLGKAKSGEKLMDKFAIKNTTDKAVVILEAKSNCGCLTLEYDKQPIKAGAMRVIDYSYDSRGKMGQQFSKVTIKTNIGDYIVLVDLFID